jgi:hypothetical protein
MAVKSLGPPIPDVAIASGCTRGEPIGIVNDGDVYKGSAAAGTANDTHSRARVRPARMSVLMPKSSGPVRTGLMGTDPPP